MKHGALDSAGRGGDAQSAAGVAACSAAIHQDKMRGEGRSRCRDDLKNVAVCKRVIPRASVGIVRSIAMLLSVAA